MRVYCRLIDDKFIKSVVDYMAKNFEDGFTRSEMMNVIREMYGDLTGDTTTLTTKQRERISENALKTLKYAQEISYDHNEKIWVWSKVQELVYQFAVQDAKGNWKIHPNLLTKSAAQKLFKSIPHKATGFKMSVPTKKKAKPKKPENKQRELLLG